MAIRRFFQPVKKASVGARTYDGRVYASKLERMYAEYLDLLIRADEIDYWTPQVTFRFTSDLSYRADFLIWASDSPVRAVDVKGYERVGWPTKRKRWMKYGPCQLWVVKRIKGRWETTEIIDPFALDRDATGG